MNSKRLTANKIKICGLTQPKQCLEVAELGFGAIGFIFYPKSPRFIEPQKATQMAKILPPFTSSIAVVVNKSIDEIESIYNLYPFSSFQLHGEETPEFCNGLSEKRIPWIKAIRVKTNFDPILLKSYPTKRFLLDAYSEDLYGGTGKKLDWEKVKSICQDYSIILAGGLNSENILHAWEKCQPSALDISSGAEISPGVKSSEKLHQLLKNIE